MEEDSSSPTRSSNIELAMPTPKTTLTLTQALLSGPDEKLNRRIPITITTDTNLTAEDLAVFDHALPIGISVGFAGGSSGKILAIALVDERNGVLIEFDGKKGTDWREKERIPGAAGRKLLEELVFCRPAGPLVGFDMGPLVLSLYSEFGFLVSNAIDIQSSFSPEDRQEIASIKAALGEDCPGVKPQMIERLFSSSEYDPDVKRFKMEVASRAWISQHIVADGLDGEVLDRLAVIDIQKLDENKRNILTKLATDALRLDHTKSLEATHQFANVARGEDGGILASAAAYKHKFRGEKNVKVLVQGPRGVYYSEGTVAGSIGAREGFIQTPHNGSIDAASVKVIETIGRDRKTAAESRRAAAVLQILQGHHDPFEASAFAANIWSPASNDRLIWPAEWTAKEKQAPKNKLKKSQVTAFRLPQLNRSQQQAINSMLSFGDRGRLVIVQGPPGTGKTSVIGTCVVMAVSNPQFTGIWLVAQSNVAVKNIAEKLISIGFEDWKLLISEDFHKSWHEHLYLNPGFKGHFIRSDDFKRVKPADLRGCKVVLCTLSMLANFRIPTFTKHIPLQFLIVDEASQIEIGNYLDVFMTFKTSLRKVCFIGDNKQLPPYGEEDLKTLQSIFEVPHLQKKIILLDTQYRMPPQIGTVISSFVYDGKLKSNPLHPVKNNVIACHWIDASSGKEQNAKSGSWMNIAEQDLVIKLAHHLQDAGTKYKIITPYEAQTSGIENKMKETDGLAWEDTCFNVDAFQGNEEDIIIISLVRTQKLGFLKDKRRTNVMLTRCKRGMYIVCNKKFISGPQGGECLVGEMLEAMQEEYGEKDIWLTGNDIQAGKLSQ